jgi:hypothetical protein
MTTIEHAPNDTAHRQPPPLVPLVPRWPVGPWPRRPVFPQPPPGAQLLPLAQDQTAAVRATRARWRPRISAVDGDMVITWSMTVVVSAVILFAAIVSYTHVHSLAAAHKEDAVQSHLLPLSLDGVIAEASLVLLFAARHKVDAPPLARVMLWAGITATLGANALVALPPQWISPVASAVIGAVLSAWPAAAFIGSVELVMRLVRDVRAVASARDSESDTEDDSDSDTEPPKTRGQGGGGNDSDDDKKPRPRRRRRTQPDPVTAAIKKGWDDDKIVARLRVTKRTIQRRRKDLERPQGAPASG